MENNGANGLSWEACSNSCVNIDRKQSTEEMHHEQNGVFVGATKSRIPDNTAFCSYNFKGYICEYNWVDVSRW